MEVDVESYIYPAQLHCWHLKLCGRQRKYLDSECVRCSGCKPPPMTPQHCQYLHCNVKKNIRLGMKVKHEKEPSGHIFTSPHSFLRAPPSPDLHLQNTKCIKLSSSTLIFLAQHCTDCHSQSRYSEGQRKSAAFLTAGWAASPFAQSRPVSVNSDPRAELNNSDTCAARG